MKQLTLIFYLFIFLVDLQGQGVAENRTGKVSFVSSENIYVRFTSTAGISIGDTIFSSSNIAPAASFVVTNLSSTSCICTQISGKTPAVNDPVVAKIKPATIEQSEKEARVTPKAEVAVAVIQPQPDANGPKQQITGSFSVATYADYSNTLGDNSIRYRYTLSLYARNIAGSKFSAESYVSFRHKKGEWSEVKNDIFSALKIYNLSVGYELNKTTHFLVGRKINPKISSIGAIDGLQFEKSFKNFAVGAIAGTRPDYSNYSFNRSLFQYGGYLAYNTKKEKAYSESSLAFMEQMNHGKTDRRFIYFQHSNSLIKNLNVFFSFEADLYRLKIDTLQGDQKQSTFSRTGVYASLRYRLTNKLTVSASYDARKNVMYYESFKNSIDTILEKEMRQGFRLQANYRIIKNLVLGIQSGYRYLTSDPLASKNINGYLTYSQFQGLNMSVTLSATYLASSYMTGKIAGINLSKDFIKGKIHSGLGYRYIDYWLPESQLNPVQHNLEVNFDWQFYRKLSLSAYYEATFEQHDRYNRIYAQMRVRF